MNNNNQNNSTYPKFSGFWLRFLAYMIDYVIIFTMSSILFVIISMPIPDDAIGPFYILDYALFITKNPLSFFIVWLYNSIMESSKFQGSVGKIITKIKVTDIEYEKIGFWQASGRNFSKFISLLTMGIGFIIAGFSKNKQALHDIMTNCFVIRTN